MTDDQPPQLPGGYGGPPPTERMNPQPYPQPYGQQYGQPYYPPPYGYSGYQGYQGYPAPPPIVDRGPVRPGLVVAASVVGFVNAGLLIVAGAVLVFGASIVRSIEDSLDTSTGSPATELLLLGLANLVAAGLLIAGGVMFTGRRQSGRIMLSVANAIVLVLLICWFFVGSDHDDDGSGGWIGWGVVFGVMAVLSLAFSFTGAINRWLAAHR